MPFETLLRAQIHRVLFVAAAAGCSGGEPSEDKLCVDVTTPSQVDGEFSRESGFLKLPVGEDCPAEPTLSQLQAADCCPVLEPQASCGLVDQRMSTEQPYYGGYDTGPNEEATICEYDAVFLAGNACCGRPLLMHGEAQVAAVLQGPSDWREGTAVLEGPGRAAAAAYWLEVAQLEHASVASFGRVALELMAHGAPADLVARSHEAALDEVRHAQAAFGLAEALGAGAVAPGALALGSSLGLAETLADVAEAVVREGCIGETVAAMDAAVRLRGAKGAVADALAMIVDDEARHAALGWATLRWLLEQGGEAVQERVAAVFAEGLPASVAAQGPSGGEAFGRVSESVRLQARQDAWAQVIVPAWRALMGPQRDDHGVFAPERQI